MAFRTKRSDVIWNYVGTVVSMASGFVLLPLLMRFLSGDELGLWYVYIAVANLAMLFEFGFTPTFARNIVYVVSGARHLTATGHDLGSKEDGVDWHLLNTVIRTSKLIYAAIAGLTFILLSSIGTVYISYITSDLNDGLHWASWVLFCVSIVLNLYFLYSITTLRGYGDVAGENQAKTIAKVSQLIISGLLLILGFGLLGASIGYFVNSVVLRGYSLVRLRQHKKLEQGRAGDLRPITFDEIRTILATISHLAWRDGLVQLALYVSTQATSILCSLFLTLEQTGTYSVILQLATAASNFAAAYPRSFFPAMQSAYAENDVKQQRYIISTGIVAYWVLYLLGTIGVAVVILPFLPLLKPGTQVDYALYLMLSLYMALLQQHSICCNYIISMNEIPYLRGYLFAAVFGCSLIAFLCGVVHIGAWGIILGQAISQIIYNNWRWPQYLSHKLDTTYISLFEIGVGTWQGKLMNRFK